MTHSLSISARRALPLPRALRAPGPRWLALAAIVAAAVAAAAFGATGRAEEPRRVLVVVDASSGRDQALVARAEAAVAQIERKGGVEGQLRVTRTPTEQLNVTHFFAARGYDAVVGVGLERGIAVTPVAQRFPDVRFVAARERGLEAAVARAARE